MAAGAAKVVQAEGGLKVLCKRGSERFKVSLRSSPRTSAEALAHAADVICDAFTVKLAVDAGQQLEGLHLGSLQAPLPSDRADSPAFMAMRAVPLSDLVAQAKRCTSSRITAAGITASDAPAAAKRLLTIAAGLGHTSLAAALLLLHRESLQDTCRGEPPLHTAARNGSADLVRLWLAEFGPAAALVAVEDEEEYNCGWLPIHAAAPRGQAEVVRMLLEAAPETAARSTPHGRTPLHHAAVSGNAATVELLLTAAPAIAAAADSAGSLPLHDAAAALSPQLVERLLAAHPEAALAADAEGRMPLHCAAEVCVLDEEEEEEEEEGEKAAKVVGILLEAAPGAAFHADDAGHLPLHLAVRDGSIEPVLRALLAVNPDAARAVANDGATALHLAAGSGDAAAVRLLAEAAPEMLLVQDAAGETPLHCAAGSCEPGGEAVEACLAAAPAGASLVTARANNGCLPLHFAAEANNLPALHAICRALPPGDVTAASPSGLAAIHFACKEGHVEAAAALLAEAPGSATLTTHFGSTPMHLAASHGRLEVIRDVLLPAAPAAVLARDAEGATPLMEAVREGHLPVLQLCLAATFPACSRPGAWLSQRMNAGATLLDVAAAHGQVPVLEHLLSLAPEPAVAACTVDEDGWVPLHYAAHNGQDAAVAVLLQASPDSVHAATNEGALPLILAVEYGHLACVRRLVAAAPATVAVQSFHNRWSAVHFAAQLGDAEVLRVLLAAAPDAAAAVLAQADQGWNAVHIATQYENREALETVLAAAPAAAMVRDSAGMLPLHVAAQASCIAAAEVLCAAAPQAVAERDGNHWTPLDRCLVFAPSDKRLEFARRLLPHGPASSLLHSLCNRRPASLPLFADLIIARQRLGLHEWHLVPSPCPGLGRALPAALAASAKQADRLLSRLPSADTARLRCFALALHRVQARRRIYLPQPLVERVLGLFDA